MRRGLISVIDADCIEKTLDKLLPKFPEGTFNTFELGTCDGHTSCGIHEYFIERGRENFHTGIDSQRDKNIQPPFPECNFIIGDTIQCHTKLEDDSQHFGFIDANHSLFYTTADFLLYRTKVKVGGYIGFHDTAPHIKKFFDYQHTGARDNPYNYISCREALSLLGLLTNRFPGWKLIFDECDPVDTAGGVCIFERIF